MDVIKTNYHNIKTYRNLLQYNLNCMGDYQVCTMYTHIYTTNAESKETEGKYVSH